MEDKTEIENLFSELSIHLDKESLSKDAVKDKFIFLCNLLDSKFSDHLKDIAPLLKNEFTQVEKESLVIKSRATTIVQISKLEGDANSMAFENLRLATEGRPPKYTKVEINTINNKVTLLKQTQTSDSATLSKVMTDIANLQVMSENYYRKPLRKIRRVKWWFRFSNLFVFSAKAILFFATILLAHYFSEFLKNFINIEGLFSEILVASIFLVTVDKLFDKAKDFIFWTRYKHYYARFNSVYSSLNEIEADFQEYKKLV